MVSKPNTILPLSKYLRKYFDNGSIVFGFETNTVNPINGKDRPMYDTRFDEPVGYYHYGTWAGKLSARGYSGYGFLPEESGFFR